MPATFQVLWILHTNWKCKSSSLGWKSQSNFKSKKVFFQNWTKTLRPREWKQRPNQKPCDPTMQSCCMRGRMLSSPHPKPYDTTMQSCCMRDRLLSSPHPETLWHDNAVMLHAWQNAIIAPPRNPDPTRQSCCMRDGMLSSPHPETLWHDNAVMLHACPNAIIAPPRNPVTQQGSHVACVTECYHRPTQKPYDTTMQSCCMRVRLLSSPHPETLWPNKAVMLHAWRNAVTQQCSHVACVSECYHRPTQKPCDPTRQSCCMRDGMLSSPHPETLWHDNAVMLHACPNAIIAPPRNPVTQQGSHVACVTECYHRLTQKPYDTTMQWCCMHDGMLSSPHPETLWPNSHVACVTECYHRPTQKPYDTTMQWCCMHDRVLSSPHPETLTQQGSHVACVTECYHRPTQKPYDTTMQSCCMHDRMLSSPHPKTWKPHESVRPSTRPQPTTYILTSIFATK